MGEVHVAMMNLLWPRSGLARQWFYDYWSGAHTQISSRLPGIHQYFEHHLDPDLGEGMPGIDAWTQSDTNGFFGDAEITFANERDLTDFAANLNPLMQDEQNVFDKTVSYQAPGDFTRSLKDETLNQSPNGNLGDQLKFMIYVQSAAGISREDWRSAFIKRVAQPLRESEHISKVRYRLVNFYDNDAVTLLAPNVSNFEAPENQFDGCLEVVFPDAMARHRYVGTSQHGQSSAALAELTRGVTCHRAIRTFTVYNHGEITLAGLRTPQMAAQIEALGARNQVGEENYRLMLGEHTFSPRYYL
ncbi:MAG: EthD domain-containing protein [Candidatus Nanopelagicales bacterium]|nr:EthD domain-containing protein [Candidatus Nanopelagicales bacterium]